MESSGISPGEEKWGSNLEQKSVACTAGQPAIGGRDPDEILSLLKDYQSLHRINPAMLALLIGLRDEDLEDIAEYFSLVGE